MLGGTFFLLSVSLYLGQVLGLTYLGNRKADVVKDYIEWAIEKGFGVIDVNIPTHTTDKNSSRPSQYEEEDQNRVKETEELAGYLWENYIELVICISIYLPTATTN